MNVANLENAIKKAKKFAIVATETVKAIRWAEEAELDLQVALHQIKHLGTNEAKGR